MHRNVASVTLRIVQLAHAVGKCILRRGGSDALFPNYFEKRDKQVLVVRRCASAGISYGRVCACVYLYITCRYCIETLAQIGLIFGVQASVDIFFYCAF